MNANEIAVAAVAEAHWMAAIREFNADPTDDNREAMQVAGEQYRRATGSTYAVAY